MLQLVESKRKNRKAKLPAAIEEAQAEPAEGGTRGVVTIGRAGHYVLEGR